MTTTQHAAGKVLVAQGGGPTAVINQSLVGVVQAARLQPGITHVYGSRFGIRGIVQEHFVDLTQETTANLERVAATPSAALGSTRDVTDDAVFERMFAVLKAHGIRQFFYIGGNGSAAVVRIVREQALRAGYPLQAFHVPKTIDNDLAGHDHSPGYASAARFVAQAFMGADLEVAALPGVYLGVVMGRDAGFLTAAAAAARMLPDDGPHLICLPERPFEMDAFLARVEQVHARLGRCVIAVSEGIRDREGRLLLTLLQESVERDPFGNVQLSGSGALADLLCGQIRTRLGIRRVRGDTFGYLQRSFLGCASDVDQREAREVGELAVHFARVGREEGSVAIQRVGNYAIAHTLLALDEVAGKAQSMGADMLGDDPFDVAPAFRIWLRPMLGSGFLQPARLRAPAVAKVLGARG